jgi:hypothetical protein
MHSLPDIQAGGSELKDNALKIIGGYGEISPGSRFVDDGWEGAADEWPAGFGE